MRLIVLTAALCVGATLAQYGPTTTPVPILKQINRHNEDGSYSYGYEAADGSYKIESKYPTGEVYGKYGFVDDTGNVREVEYGASRRGFEPAGTGINVPPPTLHGNSLAGRDDPEDDGQYREDPAIYYTDPRYTNGERYEPVPRKYPTQSYHLQHLQPLAAYKPLASKSVAAPYRRPAPLLQSGPAPLPVQPQYRPEYQPQYRTQYQGHYQPAAAAVAPVPAPYRPHPVPNRYAGQPISHLDSNLAAYSVNYRR